MTITIIILFILLLYLIFKPSIEYGEYSDHFGNKWNYILLYDWNGTRQWIKLI